MLQQGSDRRLWKQHCGPYPPTVLIPLTFIIIISIFYSSYFILVMLALVLSLWFLWALGPIEGATVLQWCYHKAALRPQFFNISINISDVSIFLKMFKILKWELLKIVLASEKTNTEMSWAWKKSFYLVKNKGNKLFQGNFWFVLVHTQYTHNIAAM